VEIAGALQKIHFKSFTYFCFSKIQKSLPYMGFKFEQFSEPTFAIDFQCRL